MAHAPGPWLVDELETRTAIKSGKRTVAYIQIAPDDYENANLIVAAPDLLAACRMFRKAASDAVEALNKAGLACPATISLAAEKAHHAIAKAENA